MHGTIESGYHLIAEDAKELKVILQLSCEYTVYSYTASRLINLL